MYKKDDTNYIKNHRPISLLSVLEKENVRCTIDLSGKVYYFILEKQYDFRKKKKTFYDQYSINIFIRNIG